MNNIEDDLKAALCRKPAPSGFSTKVLKRIEDESPGKKIYGRLYRSPFRLAAAAMILVALGAGIIGHRQYVRARNEAALNRTLTALSIAVAQLDEAEKKAFRAERWERIGTQLSAIQSGDKK